MSAFPIQSSPTSSDVDGIIKQHEYEQSKDIPGDGYSSPPAHTQPNPITSVYSIHIMYRQVLHILQSWHLPPPSNGPLKEPPDLKTSNFTTKHQFPSLELETFSSASTMPMVLSFRPPPPPHWDPSRNVLYNRARSPLSRVRTVRERSRRSAQGSAGSRKVYKLSRSSIKPTSPTP